MASTALFDDQHPIVGREREQAQLREGLTRAFASHGLSILVTGEAGIGKSTLVHDTIQQACDQGALVLSGGCYDLTATPPYGPWLEALRDYVPEAGQPAPPSIVPPHGMNTDESERVSPFEQIDQFFLELCTQQPVVAVLEDLHWADNASLDILRYLMRQTSNRRLLLILTCRDDELSREHTLYRLLPILIRESRVTRIELGRLSQDAVGKMLDSRYRLNAADRQRLTRYLGERGDGNPLYIKELLSMLSAAGLLHSSVDESWLSDLGEVRVPPLLQQVIGRRLERLSDQARDALAIAAVIGQDVPIEIWSIVSGLSHEQLANATEEATMTGVLQEQPAGNGLQFSHALVREVMYASLALPRRRVWHQRVAEALAASGSATPDTVADHFQQAGDMRAVEWFVRAGLRARRSAAWFDAAQSFENAARLLESSEIHARERGWLHFEAGFLLRFSGEPRSLDHLNAAEQLGLVINDPLLVAFSRYSRGAQRCMRGDIRGGLLDIQQGVISIDSIVESQEVPGTEVQALSVIQGLIPGTGDGTEVQTQWVPSGLNPHAHVNQQRSILIHWLSLSGRYHEAVELGEPYIDDVVRAFGDGHVQLSQCVIVHRGVGHAYAALGRPEDASREYALARAGYRDLRDYAMLEHTIWSYMTSVAIPYEADNLAERSQFVAQAAEAWGRCLGITVATVGQGIPTELPLDVLEGRWSQALEIAQDHLRAPWSPLVHEGLVVIATIARYRGEIEDAWHYLDRLLPQKTATEPGDSYFAMAMNGVTVAAELSLDTDDLVMAERWIETHDRWIDWSATRAWQVDNHLLKLRFHKRMSNLRLAKQHGELALSHASNPRQPLRLVKVHRMLGELDRQTGNYVEAGAHFERSFALAEACAAPFQRALTFTAWAELHIATRKFEEAHKLLDEAHDICNGLGAQPTLEHIARLRSAASASGPGRTSYPDGLTAREVEVLRLIAAGMSNRQIADALFLSPRTVERHIANIYLKADMHSKAEATAYALRHQLA